MHSLLSNTALINCGNVKCDKLSHYICFENKYKNPNCVKQLKDSNARLMLFIVISSATIKQRIRNNDTYGIIMVYEAMMIGLL